MTTKTDTQPSLATPRSRGPAAWLSWLLLGLTLLALVSVLILQWIGCGVLVDLASPEPAIRYGIMILPLNALVFAVLGVLINMFQPSNRFGWLANVYGCAMMWLLLVGGYGLCGVEGRVTLAGDEYAIWLNALLEVVVFLSLALIPWLFPDGRYLSPRWRWFGQAGIGLALALGGLRVLSASRLRADWLGKLWIENPVRLITSVPPWLDAMIASSYETLIMVFLLVGIVSLVLRWRRSVGEQRQQIKWLAYCFALAGTLFIAVEIIGETFYPAIFDGWFYLFELVVFWLGIPIVIGLAIFKYRLYDIDIVVRRTLVYAILTALLALIYFGSIILLQVAFRSMTGQQSPLAIVLSTLLIAALFTPLRSRIQHTIDRRFFRQKYDAQQVLAHFAARARDETDLTTLSDELAGVVQQTIQPTHVSVWFKQPSRRN